MEKLVSKPVLLVRPEHNSGFFHIHLDVVKMETPKDSCCFRIRNYSDHPIAEKRYKNLTVSCQGNDGRRDSGLYGWRLSYRDVYRVELEDAEVMVKTLRKVERKMTALDKTFGRPSCYAEFVTRVASALGISLAVRVHGTFGASSYDDMRFVIMSLEDLRDWIQYLQRDFENSGE